MAPASRRDQTKEAHRLALLDAAFALFVERGFAATRIEDVAVQAGVAKGTVVAHFASKEALFEAVVLHQLSPEIANAAAILAEAGSARDRLVRMLTRMDASLREPRLGAIPKLLVSEVGNFPDLARSFHSGVCTRFRQIYAELIRQGIAAGEFRRVDAEIHAQLLGDPLVMQAIWRHSFGRYEPCPTNPVDYFAAHLDACLRALAPESD